MHDIRFSTTSRVHFGSVRAILPLRNKVVADRYDRTVDVGTHGFSIVPLEYGATVVSVTQR